MKPSCSKLICLIVATANFVGCAPMPVQWEQQGVDLVWPSPPDVPRIKYLRSLTGAADFHEDGTKDAFLRWMTGERQSILPLVSPYGIAADGQGTVWVADLGVQAVHVIDLQRRKVDYITVAGDVPLVAPVGVVYDQQRDRIYVSDSAQREVFIFDRKGRRLGSVVPAEGFQRPGGLAIDRQGHLYVVDVMGSKVYVFDALGKQLRLIESAAPPDYVFNRPVSVAVDHQNNVYVVDSMNFRVEVFDAEGRSQTTIGQLGDGPGLFARPRGVGIDSRGHVYVVDAAFGNVQVFDTKGNLLTYFGGIGVKPGQFDLPSGIYLDARDRIYVADPLNNRLQIFQYLDSGG